MAKLKIGFIKYELHSTRPPFARVILRTREGLSEVIKEDGASASIRLWSNLLRWRIHFFSVKNGLACRLVRLYSYMYPAAQYHHPYALDNKEISLLFAPSQFMIPSRKGKMQFFRRLSQPHNLESLITSTYTTAYPDGLNEVPREMKSAVCDEHACKRGIHFRSE